MTAAPAATHEKKQYPLSPGMRGKYGESASKQYKSAAPGYRRFMSCGTDTSRRGCILS